MECQTHDLEVIVHVVVKVVVDLLQLVMDDSRIRNRKSRFFLDISKKIEI